MEGTKRTFDTQENLEAAKQRITPEEVYQIPVEKIATNPFQPRTVFNEQELQELAATIKERGVLQPIVARKVDGEMAEHPFEIIAGERRWRAAKLAGLTTVPVILKTADDQKSRENALIENVQRVDLCFWDTMNSYAGLLGFRDGAKEIASVAGKETRTIEMYLKCHREISSIPEICSFYAASTKESEKRRMSLTLTAAYEFAGYAADLRRLSKSNQKKYNDMLKQIKKQGIEGYLPKLKTWFERKKGVAITKPEQKIFDETDKELILKVRVRKNDGVDGETLKQIEDAITSFKERLAALNGGGKTVI